MEAKASARYQRIPPRKLRLAADLVRGKDVDESLRQLAQSPTKSARIVTKVLNAAVANAVDLADEIKLEPEHLFIKKIWVDGGPIIKRFRARAMGRATRINKRTSHVTIVVDSHMKAEEE